MAEDWDKLASEWEGHAVGLVAEVDCTDEEGGGQALCEDFDVQGFPTIMYGDPSSPETYEGGREYDDLAEFAKENISKANCGLANIDLCPEDVKTIVLDLQTKSIEDLQAVVTDVDAKLKENEAAYEAQLEELNDTYEKMVAAHTAKNEDLKTTTNYKWVKQIVAASKPVVDATADAAADEL